MKKFLTYVSLGLILLSCFSAAVTMADMPRTYEGQNATVSVYELQQNLAKSNALNDVTSIVFDFRGYDTMGEAFILCTAVAGSIVILYSAKKDKKEENKDE